jgi:tyrosyl-tRNA synthetase
MRIIGATILAMAVLAGSAHAQVEDKSARQKAEETAAAKERAEIEKEYNATIKRIGAPKNAGKSDPWGGIRSSGGADGKR